MIKKLHKDTLNICKRYVTSTWSNGWMWKNKGKAYGNDILIYHFLIVSDDDDYFEYSDTSDLEITIERHESFTASGRFRIDIKNRFGVHNWWYFDGDDFKYVSLYLLEMIQTQYDYIISKHEILNMTDGAYDEIEPENMYKIMNSKLRTNKLGRLLINKNKYEN